MNFPNFDGANPRLWISRSEDYFDMYHVSEDMWIKIAAMHFTDAAARWLQSVEKSIRTCSWPEFCRLVLDRFGRDQHEQLIRQLFHIKQEGSVKDYIEQFSELVDQLTAYESKSDPLYYTLRFIDGLRDDIKSVITVQRPSTLDTACSLAQLQEKVGGSLHRPDGRKPEFSVVKPYFKRHSAQALPLPPPKADRHKLPAS